MTDMNLNELTVLELRKVAKEMKVPLSAGISKQGIIDRLTAAMAEQGAPAAAPEAAPSLEEAAEAMPEADEAVEDKPEESAFKQAYAAPARFNARPAYQAPAFNRQSAQRTPAPMDTPRPAAPRPAASQSRFGPAAHVPAQDAAHDEERSRYDAPRGGYGPIRSNFADNSRFQQRPAYEQQPAYEQPRQPAYEQRPAYDQPRQPAYEQRPAYDQPRQPAYEQRPAYDQPRQPAYEQRPQYDRPAYPPRQNFSQESAPYAANPNATEIAQAIECPEQTGCLEILPEGYGFLRSEGMFATNKDVYLSATQIRRFGLRTGDKVTGKVRPIREGDKYPALLTVSQVNGGAPDEALNRPNFEAMTPIYPKVRINLERKDAPQLSDLRLMDLTTPIGFGQRGLIQCGPRTGKTRLLQHLANVIRENHPEAHVMVLLFNETPEDVTVFREQVTCPVLATTFDMAPENHLKLTDMVLEQAQRMVELKRDVVLLVDSLTTLTKVASTAALQQGRVVPGMINPASLHKAKRLFGAARCLREGGSLTVIATMNMDNGNKVDDSVVNEFRAAANMELVLDQTLAKAGVYPPIALAHSGTRKAEAILTPAHMEGIKLIRGILSTMPAANAVQELKSMMEKAPTNEDLLVRIKDWIAAIQA